MLEGIKYDNRPVASVFQAEMVDGTKHHQVMITYGDELEPKTEIMSEEEWKAMQQKEGDTHPRSFYLTDATDGMRKRIMEEFGEHNSRLVELSKITRQVGADLGNLVTVLYNTVFGVKHYEVDLTFKDVLEVYKKAGKEPDYQYLDEKQLKVLEVLTEQGVTIESLVFFAQELKQQMERIRDIGIGHAVGIPLANIRIDDLIQFVEKNKPKEEAKSE